MHTFVFSLSVYHDVLHNLDESIYSLRYIYQHCGTLSSSWNTASPSSPISSFQFPSFLHICHIYKIGACFHRECTLVPQRMFSQPISHLFSPSWPCLFLSCSLVDMHASCAANILSWSYVSKSHSEDSLFFFNLKQYSAHVLWYLDGSLRRACLNTLELWRSCIYLSWLRATT